VTNRRRANCERLWNEFSCGSSLLAYALVPADLDGARRWYEQAAAGHAAAKTNLALLAERRDPRDLDGTL
jgi:TPR repeat protein